ncbi:PAS domain-containing protein [Sphingobium sufflavum]|uniref:PAS domain-containing protein n=1 Tax=Sphingobium sufflavum TaxID=1129547 RepID=UPI001F2E21EB|nr:PAS domain-containing protein [Sphingobium sufflavum]MCE7795671.1 PAS domain-containing protein [Sphingobium sufflavum]
MASENKILPVIGAFLTGGGEMGDRIARFDWTATSIGPLDQWPQSLRSTVSLMLRSDVPMVLLWNSDGVMIYNDAYSDFAGGRDSTLLGSKVRDGWDEIAEFNDNVMRVGLAGQTLQYKNHALFLNRDGRPEKVWMDLDYSPVLGEDGHPAGVIAIVVETTEAERTRAALEDSESRLRFLDTLGRAVAESRDADEILAITTRMTGEHLGLSNCAYADMDADQDGFTIRGNWHDPAAPSILGHYCLADFGKRAVQELGAGRPLIVHDNLVELAPEEAATFQAMGIAATICMPLVKEGRLTALMAIHDSAPRRWSDYDLSVIREVTQRSWAHVERVGTEQDLRDREAQLRRSQQAGAVGLFSIDIGTNIISCTPEFCRIFGLEPQEFLPAHIVEALILPSDAAIVSNDERRRSGAALLDVEYRIRRADTGEERIIARKGEYERDETGKPVRLVGAVQDTTERRRIQLALEKSEAGFSALAQFMPNQVWTGRTDGQLDWFNDQVYSYCGLPQGALDGAGWAQIVHPDDLETAIPRWTAALESGTTYQTEFRLRNAEGEYRWFLSRAVPLTDSSGMIRSWIGTNTDIHEQKLQEATTTADRNRLWTISQDLLLVCDYEGRITAINPSAQTMLGWEEEDMVGRLLTDFIHPDDLASTAAEVAKISTGITTLHFENRYRCKDDSYRLLDWTAVPDGDRIHGVGRDITEQRETEDALRQSQKMEAVGQLTGGIAHDFNNLLQGITGSLEIMEGRLAQGRQEDLPRWLSGAKSSAMRAAALTHRLLAFSRRQPLDPRPVRANPLISSMEDMLRRTLGETVQLELVTAGGLWLTKCDPNQLESAILNLAINARDAMPEGGKLIIETCNAHLDSAYAARQREVKPGQYICICVTDTGVGMDKDVIERAFEPFFTTKPTGQGTGLGLSMIYGFTRQSEGYARIYSEAGKGTTIKLYLPRFRGADEPHEALPTLAEAPGSEAGETVLVVEDEAVVRGLIVEVLGELGYRAIEAADGVKGLEILRSDQRIDLLVTDIGLPGLNGRQVADGARIGRPDLKVLFMTGYAENAALASGFLEPGMAMITKPFAMEVLATRIREIIGDKGGA